MPKSLPYETTEVSVAKSMGEIESYLDDIRAEAFCYQTHMTSTGKVIQISFTLNSINYSMPFNIDKVSKYLQLKHSGWDSKRIEDQAKRTSARQLRDFAKTLFMTEKLKIASIETLLLGFTLVSIGNGQIARLGEIFTRERLQVAQTQPMKALPAPEPVR